MKHGPDPGTAAIRGGTRDTDRRRPAIDERYTVANDAGNDIQLVDIRYSGSRLSRSPTGGWVDAALFSGTPAVYADRPATAKTAA